MAIGIACGHYASVRARRSHNGRTLPAPLPLCCDLPCALGRMFFDCALASQVVTVALLSAPLILCGGSAASSKRRGSCTQNKGLGQASKQASKPTTKPKNNKSHRPAADLDSFRLARSEGRECL